MKLFSKEPAIETAESIIREEMLFLLEPNERRFDKLLRAHLLDDGCNFPVSLAKPRFYHLMISGLLSKGGSSVQSKFAKVISPEQAGQYDTISHAEFYNAIKFFRLELDDAGKTMALEVSKSIQSIFREWQLDPNIFQQDFEQYQAFVQTTVDQLWNASGMEQSEEMSFDLIRRRLYMALTTSLLSKMNARNVFEQEFSSVPDALRAMKEDHQNFCRFIKFCQERTRYFTYIASQTFWRTLETLRTEELAEHQRNAK